MTNHKKTNFYYPDFQYLRPASKLLKNSEIFWNPVKLDNMFKAPGCVNEFVRDDVDVSKSNESFCSKLI